ncbi:hypothetical protein PRIPAC_91414 [Pristionchus pacificus]|uniref:Uncharacterized protein n=1 Tax=Pristionchus pacificus TaxID=54126 RepID=A0A2A6CYB6_PRIPA|nr:hypothetical protein PRIPAC_91414 [Pristionchus pacificus]|eukprot:PDM83165.1 hypothetical protein PRIPAC_37558 [Pristionchus pacificus]
MFPRGSSTARLPVTVLRLYCSSAPSTSYSASRIAPATVSLSLRHNHAIASCTPEVARHFGASLVWIRGGQGKDWEEAEEVKGARTKHTDGSSGNSGGPEPIKPMGPNPPSKGKLFVMAALLSMAVTSLIFSTLIAESTVADSAIPADAPQVDFETFAKKYLRAGEVQKITYVVGKDKAVGTLFPGAIIDGKPAKSAQIVINYPHAAPQFWADVRAEEQGMGIALSQGVDIQTLNPVSGWRMIEFFIGCFILGWLCTSYGRLIVKKMAEEKAKKGMK